MSEVLDQRIPPRFVIVLALGACLLAATTRLPGLGSRSLASTEQVRLVESQGLDPREPVPEDEPVEAASLPRREGAWDAARGARVSPLDTGFLALWTQWVGRSETALRLPSALAGVAAVAVVALITAHVAGPWAAGVAGLLVALSPIHTLASREAGPGAGQLLLVALSLWLTFRVEDAGRPRTALVFGLAIGLQATGPAALLGLACLQVAWLARLVRRFDRRDTAGLAVAVALLVLALLWALGLLRSPLAEGADLGWVPATTLAGMVRCAGASFTRIAGLEYHLVVSHARYVAPLTLVVVGLSLLGASRLSPRRRWLLLGGVVVPFALGALLSLLTGHVTPLQAHRMMPALPFLAVLAGAGLVPSQGWRSWTAGAVVLGATGVFLMLALIAPPRETSPTWTLAREIARCRPGEAATSVQRPLDLLALAAWRVPGPLLLRGAGEGRAEGPTIEVGPRTACARGFSPSTCPGIPPCPSE